VSSGFGPAGATGEGAAAFERGQSASFDVLHSSPNGTEWVLRAGYTRFDASAGTGLDLQFMNGGQNYVPVTAFGTSTGALNVTTFELGLRRTLGTGVVRPFLESFAGVASSRQPAALTPYLNDRRPDLAPPRPGPANAFSPALSLGAGVEVRGPAHVALIASLATTWAAMSEFTGATLPLRFGAAWPAAPDQALDSDASANRGPRLRMSAGTSLLRTPRHLERQMHAAPSFAASLEVPLSSGIALVLLGEQAAQSSEVLAVVRQEMDAFGNLVNVYDTRSLSMTVHTLTAGAQWSRSLRHVTPALRAGLGWGRTGGFGNTVTATSGAYLDNGQWVPVGTAVDFGAGAPASGFAWSAGATLDVHVAGPGSAFAEVGAVGLEIPRRSMLLLPLRAGIVLR